MQVEENNAPPNPPEQDMLQRMLSGSVSISNASSNAPPAPAPPPLTAEYLAGNMNGNVFFNHCVSTEAPARIANEEFQKFCIFCCDEFVAPTSIPDLLLKQLGQYYYVDVYHVTCYVWDAVCVQWADWIRCTKLLKRSNDEESPFFDRYNFFLLHVSGVQPYKQGETLNEFIKQATVWTETLDEDTAVHYSEWLYKRFFNSLLESSKNRPFKFPPWNERAFREYFYKIRRTEAAVRRSDLEDVRRQKRRLLESSDSMHDKMETLFETQRFGAMKDVATTIRTLQKTRSEMNS